jgi:2-dehydro-3-deoxyphosphooctonate aldolase (KDO 8-P synthase)
MAKKKKFLLIAGPCVLESEALGLEIGKKIKALTEELSWDYVFKASYDKANRTSADSYRGPGLVEGLKSLEKIKNKLGVPVLTDVHSVEEATEAGKVVDILQIPAFLCRQTDLVIAATETGCGVNVKKGQFLSANEINPIVDKIKEAGGKNYWITERGNSFGYQNLVVDMRNLVWIREQGHPVIFDATHSVQRPGGLGKVSGGDGNLAPFLARAAMAVGIDGLFIETHPNPSKAKSDGPNMIPLAQMPQVLRKLKCIHEAISN